MANIHFFTDVDLMNQQTNAQAFGPVLGDEDTKYRVASMHSASIDPQAYAITNGTVFIQEDKYDNSKVNLILKPDQQPMADFPKILFYVYRGILKNSLINGNKIAVRTNNDLTQTLHNSQDDINAVLQSQDDPPAEALGIHHTSGATGPEQCEDNDPIQKVFFKDYDDHQFPVIKGGDHIGDFDATGFGLQIIVERQGHEPLFGDIRTLDHVVEISSLPPSPDQADYIEYWHDKETVLSYLDPCAFYGSCYKEGVFLDGSLKKGAQIFDDILEADSNNPVFYNKNTIYLDIRNEHNHSFNYYKNYGTSPNNDNAALDMAFDESSSLNSYNYYRSNWPLFKMNISDFPAGITGGKNVIRIAFPEGDNNKPLVFLAQGYWKVNFLGTFGKEERTRFSHLEVNEGVTGEIALSVPNREGTDTTPVSSYLRLRYLKSIEEDNATPSSGTVIRSENYIDNLAMPFEGLKTWDYAGDQKRKAFGERCYVDARTPFGKDCMARSEMIKDDNGDVTCLFIMDVPDQGYGEKEAQKTSSLSQRKMSSDRWFFFDMVSEVPDFKYSKVQLRIDTGSGYDRRYVPYLEDNRVVPSFLKPTTEHLTWIHLNKDDIEELEKIYNSTSSNPYNNFEANFDKKYGVRLGLKLQERTTASNNVDFSRYEFVLSGFERVSGNLQIREVFSGLYHDMVDWIRESILNQQITIQSGTDGYTIHKDQDTDDEDQVIEEFEIETTIYLDPVNVQRQLDTIPANSFWQMDEVQEFRDYIEENISLVWNSATNNGLPQNISTNITYVLLNENSPTPVLGENELYVRLEMGPGTSYVEGNQRRGVYYFNNSILQFFTNWYYPDPQSPHMPAHEFGHFLGLADRYTYVGYYRQSIRIMNHHNGLLTNLYTPPGYDNEYDTHYRWAHNLMSSGLEVGCNPLLVGRIVLEASYSQYYSNNQPIMNPLYFPQKYVTLTIFVTEKQWHFIKYYESEKDEINQSETDNFLRYDNYVFFKYLPGGGFHNAQQLGTNNFNGTFAGRKNIGDQTGIASDDGYRLLNPHQDNNSDHNMQLRIRNWQEDEPSNSDPLLTNIIAHYSPYWSFDGSGNPNKDVGVNILNKAIFQNPPVGFDYYRYLLAVSMGEEYPYIYDPPRIMPEGPLLLNIIDFVNSNPEFDNNIRQNNDFYNDFGHGDNWGQQAWNERKRRYHWTVLEDYGVQFGHNRWLIINLIQFRTLNNIPDYYDVGSHENHPQSNLGFQFLFNMNL